MYITLAILLASIPTTAQDRKTVQQSSLWLWAAAQVQVHRHFGILAESVVRVSDFQRLQQNEFHLGAEIYINNNVIVTPLAYGYFLNYVYGKLPAAVEQNEHRLWQQVLYRNNFCRLNLNLRLRSEENWRERKVKDANGHYFIADYTFRARIRPRIMANIALNTKSFLAPKTIFLSVWDELFMPVGVDIATHLPDENRAFIGLGYRFTPWAVLNAGYLHQYLLRNNATQAESNHTLMVQAFFQINAQRSKPAIIKP